MYIAFLKRERERETEFHNYKDQNNLSLVTTKPVFGVCDQGKTQTGLVSYTNRD